MEGVGAGAGVAAVELGVPKLNPPPPGRVPPKRLVGGKREDTPTLVPPNKTLGADPNAKPDGGGAVVPKETVAAGLGAGAPKRPPELLGVGTTWILAALGLAVTDPLAAAEAAEASLVVVTVTLGERDWDPAAGTGAEIWIFMVR